MYSEQIEKLVDEAANPLITTIDCEGFPVTRAMMGLRLRENLSTLYFSTNLSTNKAREVQKNNKGSVYFFDSNKFLGLSFKGTFEVATDLDAKKKVWRDGDELYYPKGILDDDFCVLIFKVNSGRFYSDFNSKNFKIGE